MNATQREDLRHLLSTSGTMSGLCITAATLFSTVRNTASKTIVDDIFVLSALIFLLCTYCLFCALRTRHQRLIRLLARLADALFAIAMTAMVSGGFIMTYTLW
jgi:hypothetical protein